MPLKVQHHQILIAISLNVAILSTFLDESAVVCLFYFTLAKVTLPPPPHLPSPPPILESVIHRSSLCFLMFVRKHYTVS